MTKKRYEIGEFAGYVGLSAYTLRYYENQKLIIPHRDENNRRYYTDQDVKWVGFLLHLKGTGMTIGEIKNYVELRALGDETIEQRKELLTTVQKNVVNQINELQSNLTVINHKIDWYSGKLDNTISQSEDFEEYLKRFEIND